MREPRHRARRVQPDGAHSLHRPISRNRALLRGKQLIGQDFRFSRWTTVSCSTTPMSAERIASLTKDRRTIVADKSRPCDCLPQLVRAAVGRLFLWVAAGNFTCATSDRVGFASDGMGGTAMDQSEIAVQDQTATPPPAPAVNSGLMGLALIAGYYRIAADPAQLKHQLALIGRFANSEDLVRGANILGLKSRILQPRHRQAARRHPLSRAAAQQGGRLFRARRRLRQGPRARRRSRQPLGQST